MDSRTLKRLIDIRETNPKWKNKGATATPRSQINPGPEATPYDQARHEKMNLKSPLYGNKFFVSGFAPPKLVCPKCDRLVSMCVCGE